MRGARSASHIVSSLTMEELRIYYEIPDNIDLKLMDKPDESTLGGGGGGGEDTMLCFLLESNLRPDFVSQCPPLSNSFYILLGRRLPLFILA